jgi:hypothetical protein
MTSRAVALGVLLVVASCGSDDKPSAGADAGAGAHGGSGALAGSSAGGAAGSVPPIKTGLPPDKKLVDLTPAERQGACDKITSTINGGSITSDYCKISATLTAALASGFTGAAGAGGSTSDAELRSTCSGFYDDCTKQQNATTTACQMTGISSTCTATVAEFEGCGTAQVQALHEAAARLPSCNQLTAQTAGAALVLLGTSPLQATAAACMTFNQKCPGVLGGLPMR